MGVIDHSQDAVIEAVLGVGYRVNERVAIGGTIRLGVGLFKVEATDQPVDTNLPTPGPGWVALTYVEFAALPTFRTQDNSYDDDDENPKPTAKADSAVSNNGQALIIQVLANDTDPDGNMPLKVVGLAQPDSGKGSVSTDGLRVTYTPPATIAAPFTASFTYQAKDTKGAESAQATVTVAVSKPATR